MDATDRDTLQAELNEQYARAGCYLAAWLERHPGHLLTPPEPEELVRLYHERLNELDAVRQLAESRRALLDKEEVQAVLWLGRRRWLQWPPLKRALLGSLRAARRFTRAGRA